MPTAFPDTRAPQMRFQQEAIPVLENLRQAIRGLLSELGGIAKPADVQKALATDRTLSWQLFKVAGTANILGCGSAVPSRTSMKRILEVARTKGVSPARIDHVASALEEFETFVQTAAGDRSTFNSMVSVFSDVDHEWSVMDQQHRRNMFRGLSHAKGFQIKTNLGCGIIRRAPDGTVQMATLTGLLDLRVLRPIEALRVYGVEFRGTGVDRSSVCTPHRFSQACGGYLLESFSTQPAPHLRFNQGDFPDGNGWWLEALLEWPEVGNFGTSSLFFSEVTRGLRCSRPGEVCGFQTTVTRPIETLIIDTLIDPAITDFATPEPVARWASNARPESSAENQNLPGEYLLDSLGRGIHALATPEIPRYADMLLAIIQKLGWDTANFTASRLRIEFPLFQSIAGIHWTLNDQLPTSPAPTST